eukprot:TRINITY_DN101710_c0_g1_i1.p1 TRINITY_DN101710_c0_g1~~TRINITY_DN101710_c0_g1_i1.p1  ORF type:complete len:423 (-),score=78.47 TRINITY_DN101710_c0_g1_i1:209-1411(-)
MAFVLAPSSLNVELRSPGVPAARLTAPSTADAPRAPALDSTPLVGGLVCGLGALSTMAALQRRRARAQRATMCAGKNQRLSVVISDSTDADDAVEDAGGSGPAQMRESEELSRYKVEFAARDAPEWTSARVLSVEAFDGGELITLGVDGSREHVPLERAYHTPGQRAQLRWAEDDVEKLHIASPPASLTANRAQLWRLKGDIYAGQKKSKVETESMELVLDVIRPRGLKERSVQPGDTIEVGPFTGEGIDVRPVQGRFTAPVLSIFCDGSVESLGSLRAALEASDCGCELSPRDRLAVLLFCAAPEGLPATLESWLAEVQQRHRLSTVNIGSDPLSNWSGETLSALKPFLQQGENIGGLVLGSPEFVDRTTQKLAEVGIMLTATSTKLRSLAKTVEPEQI